MKKETAIEVADTGYLVLQKDSNIVEIVEENLGSEGVSAYDLDRVKIPAGGATAFEIPTLDGEESAKDIEGIIIYWKTARAYWPEKFNGENNPPQCSSVDGEVGQGNPGGYCAKCPLAQFGSADNGKGQACKQMRQLFIVRENDILPLVLTLPPTSIKPAKQYFMRLASKGIKYTHAVTRITLEKAKSGEGITYSKAAFALVKQLEPAVCTKIDAFTESIRPM
ncbi:MAG TPA: hypothetical protein PKG85_09540, partial [Mesotoga infera]|nr:hypothetical protein [Mesotoga infera]